MRSAWRSSSSRRLDSAPARRDRAPQDGGTAVQAATLPLSGGAPLDAAVQAEMEQRFGADFSGVRVHTGAEAELSASAQLARAYTVGSHIVFNRGRYAPHGSDGRRLLAHELAHVVQQTQRGAGGPSNEAHEHEADAAADAAVGASGPVSVASAAATGVQAQPLTWMEISQLDQGQVYARLQENEAEYEQRVLNEDAYAALEDEHRALNARLDELNVQAPASGEPVQAPADAGEDPIPQPETPAPREPSGRPADVSAARAFEARGVREFGGEVPYTEGTGGLSTIRVGPYLLGPNAIQCDDGTYAPLYYVAYHLERQRNEWVVGPSAVAQFRQEHEQRDQQSETNAQAEEVPFGPAIPLHAGQARAGQMQGIQPHYMTESVPRTSQEGEAETAGPYDLVPHQINTADGQVVTLYYTARDRGTQQDQWVIGPDAIADFRTNAGNRHGAAALAYYNGPPHQYEAESTRWVEGAMAAISGEGNWSDAFSHLGNAWGLAVRDPKWQIQAVAAHVPVHRAVAALGPLARVASRRAAPWIAGAMIGVENGLPAVRMGAGSGGSAIVQMEGRALATEVQQGVQSGVQQGVQAVVQESAPAVTNAVAPTLAPALQSATPGLASQLTGVGVQGAMSQLGAQSIPIQDFDIVEQSTVQGPAQAARPDRVARSQAAADTRANFGSVRDGYAQQLQVAAFGQVHHAIEVQVLSRYPGVYTEGEINAFGNMRGIPPELERRTQLHNSKIREVLDRHYVALDAEIARQGLQPGTQAYNDLVRAWMDNARAEIDWALGQFFSEQRALLFTPP